MEITIEPSRFRRVIKHVCHGKIGIISALLFTPLCSLAVVTIETQVDVDDPDAAIAGFMPQNTQVNELPCGQKTLAVINTEDSRQYVFCAGDEGTAVMELKPDNGKGSLLDEISDPIELLATVTPAPVSIPDEILVSVADGKPLSNGEIFRVGEFEMLEQQTYSTKAACAMPSLGFSMSEFINDSTFCGTVAGSSNSSNNSAWHHHWASALHVPGQGSASHTGPSPNVYQWSADDDEDGDARYGRARVRSCGGTTQFRGWVKASPTTGSWSPLATYYVPSGYYYTMKWYSNSQRSIWMGYDADDIRFRADALGNASFGSRFYFLKYAWGNNCDLKY